jgi:microcystin-dependent protein
MFAGNFAPTGWALCDGQVLPISQNTALFSLLGTNYGGDGLSNFALPNLQGSVPIGQGSGAGLTPRAIGSAGGAASVVLTASEGAAHTHAAMASTGAATTGDPTGALLAATPASNPIYVGSAGEAITMGALALGNTPAATQAHNNLQPYVVLTFIIALTGIFPARN